MCPMSDTDHGPWAPAEAEMATWPPKNQLNTRTMYDRLRELGFKPTVKIGKEPRYLHWKYATRPGRSEIYLGPTSIDFLKPTFTDLLGGLKGANDRSRVIKFWTNTPEDLQCALKAAELAASFLE
jgi:hypothetical protein